MGNSLALQALIYLLIHSIQRKEAENLKRSAGSTKEAIYMQKKRDNSERSVEKRKEAEKKVCFELDRLPAEGR